MDYSSNLFVPKIHDSFGRESDSPCLDNSPTILRSRVCVMNETPWILTLEMILHNHKQFMQHRCSLAYNSYSAFTVFYNDISYADIDTCAFLDYFVSCLRSSILMTYMYNSCCMPRTSFVVRSSIMLYVDN